MARNGVTLGQALGRGLRRKCPHCGEASAFRSYLKIVDVCPSCQTPLGLYPCDDGPAYLTILIVGHIVVGPTFLPNEETSIDLKHPKGPAYQPVQN